VKLGDLLRGTSSRPPRPRRRRSGVRADAPRTIVPVVDTTAAPSSALAQQLDAARERLRREIPPVEDEGAEAEHRGRDVRGG